LSLQDKESLLGHPIVGPSWEGFVLENLLSMVSPGTDASFYRTSAGAEVDLVLTFPGGRVWAIEIKRSVAPKLERGFHNAWEDLQPERGFLVYAGVERFPVGDGIEAIGLIDLCKTLLTATTLPA
jgi:hypothetical protein